jgi:hypothetical protein
MIVSHLLWQNTVLYLCLKPEMWQKVAKFKGAEYFRKALYLFQFVILKQWLFGLCFRIPVRTLFDSHPEGGVAALALSKDSKYLVTVGAGDVQVSSVLGKLQWKYSLPNYQLLHTGRS